MGNEWVNSYECLNDETFRHSLELTHSFPMKGDDDNVLTIRSNAKNAIK